MTVHKHNLRTAQSHMQQARAWVALKLFTKELILQDTLGISDRRACGNKTYVPS